MNLGVRGGRPKDHSEATAEEKNRSWGPLKSHTSGCLVSDRDLKIYVNVPPKVSGITCQTDTDAYELLVEAFELVIKTSVEQDYSSVAIPSLGTSYQKWSQLQSSSAARKAVERIKDEIPEDFTVFFCVPYDYVEIWDKVMDFCV